MNFEMDPVSFDLVAVSFGPGRGDFTVEGYRDKENPNDPWDSISYHVGPEECTFDGETVTAEEFITRLFKQVPVDDNTWRTYRVTVWPRGDRYGASTRVQVVTVREPKI
jgi:hypothetical protein